MNIHKFSPSGFAFFVKLHPIYVIGSSILKVGGNYRYIVIFKMG